MSVRGRLLILAAGAVVPLLLVSLAALWGIWIAKQERLNEAIEQQAELAAVVFEHWLDTQRQPLITLAANVARPDSDLRDYLRFVSAPRSAWIDLRLLNAQGETVLAHPAPGENLPSGLTEKLLAGSPQGAVETDWSRGEGQYVLAVAVPVTGGGAAVARIDGAALKELFRDLQLPERALVTLFDSQRRIIFRSQAAEEFLGTGLSDSAMLAAIDGRRTAVTVIESPLDGVERVYGMSRAGSTDYVMTVGVPSATLYEPARRELTRLLAFGLLALICTLTAALLIARGIARPMARLGRAARSFGEGDLSARAPSNGSSELAKLGAAFNAMAARIEERELRFNELDRLKSEFVSATSHELRTPLTTIKALTRLLLRGGLSEAKQREYLGTIAQECDRQIDLVLNLLDLSRIEAGAFELSLGRVEAAEVLLSSLKSQSRPAEFRGHQLRLERTAGLPPILADQKALRRVICNLIENAIKYTPDGGQITLAARPSGDEVEISVTDNGRGIPPQDMPHLFDKFHRGRPDSANGAAQEEAPGIGLGLYLAHNIIEQMGGRISVESEVGRGSAFTIHLPVWSDQEPLQLIEEESGDGQTIAGRR